MNEIYSLNSPINDVPFYEDSDADRLTIVPKITQLWSVEIE